jgi:hypothetical protein
VQQESDDPNRRLLPVTVEDQPPLDNTKYAVLACFVCCCCNLPVGLLALATAVCADQVAKTNYEGGKALGRCSLYMSIWGIFVSVVVILLAVVLHIVYRYDH